MRFIPNSKILRKHTQGNELIVKKTQQPYKGPYIQTHENKLHAGHSNINLGAELQYLTELYDHGSEKKNLSNIGRSRTYNILKPTIKKKLSKTTTPPTAKPIPSPQDYIKGYYKRYFFKKINDLKYTEISKNTYFLLENKTYHYDHNLLEAGFIIWNLTGDNIHKLNYESIESISNKFPNLITIFPILDEYALKSNNPKIQENLNTDGGELYYVDGNEYIGAYHIHPEKGPMVGAFHADHDHERLYYTNQLPSFPDSTYEDFLNNFGKITCYSCRVINNKPQIITSQHNKISGCPEKTYESNVEAFNNCKGLNNLSTNGNSGGSGTVSGGGGGY